MILLLVFVDYKNPYLIEVRNDKFHAPGHSVKEISLEDDILLDQIEIFLLLLGKNYLAVG